MASIFTKIINSEIPCYKIAETDFYFAFLDINPLHKGHTLVIPKMEVDDLFDLPDEVYTGLLTFAKNVAAAIKQTIPCNRVGVAVVGLEVPHAHIHLIPINAIHDIDFTKKRIPLSKEEFEEIALAIKENMVLPQTS